MSTQPVRLWPTRMTERCCRLAQPAPAPSTAHPFAARAPTARITRSRRGATTGRALRPRPSAAWCSERRSEPRAGGEKPCCGRPSCWPNGAPRGVPSRDPQERRRPRPLGIAGIRWVAWRQKRHHSGAVAMRAKVSSIARLSMHDAFPGPFRAPPYGWRAREERPRSSRTRPITTGS
jgi:hypothetical protein